MKTTNDDHTQQYRLLHEKQADYGSSSIKYLPEISLLINYLKPKSVLDYGCGKGALLKALSLEFPGIAFHAYDPSISGLEKLPVESADLVINTDVLEHVPAELVPNVLSEIANISRNAIFACHHALAKATLADGTNAHCTVRPPVWYQTHIMKVFGDEIIALEGRQQYLSMILTFPVHANIVGKYTNIIRGGGKAQMHIKKDIKEPPLRRLFRHLKAGKF